MKYLELRDRATCVEVFAFQVDPSSKLAWAAGYASPLILMGRLDGEGYAKYDPFAWRDRTFQVAHLWIQDNWDSVNHEDVIDVEYLLGETKQPKTSQYA